MKLPVFNMNSDQMGKRVADLDVHKIGEKVKLFADRGKIVGTRHTKFTGQPHPVCIILPEGSNTIFELRDDNLIYISCDKDFKCEGEHSSKGPYQTFDCEAHKEFWVSGEESININYAKITNTT